MQNEKIDDEMKIQIPRLAGAKSIVAPLFIFIPSRKICGQWHPSIAVEKVKWSRKSCLFFSQDDLSDYP